MKSIQVFVGSVFFACMFFSQINEVYAGDDSAYAITTDAAGNVYVTGTSQGSPLNGFDYVTIKYNSSGTQQWLSRYNGPGNGDDTAKAIAVDSSGNVYVTGSAQNGSLHGLDYTTIKYNSAGTQLWATSYNGSGSGNDIANAIAVDSSGNVYVTGSAQNGSLRGLDYTTVKYNSAGTQLWATSYNGSGNSDDAAYAIAIDGSGNVYVTGTAQDGATNGLDYTTVKYNSAGTQQWARAYNGSGNGNDAAYAIAVDGSGNVYVTGSAQDGATNGLDYTTIKYNSAGTFQWARAYNGPGNGDDAAYAIAVDSSGNVYVTGTAQEGGVNGFDYATIKYNSAGTLQWLRGYNGVGNGSDGANAIAVDGSGNVYVTGSSQKGGLNGIDYTTVKYNSAGTLQWASSYNGPGSGSDIAYGVALDSTGNVYVTGSSLGASPNGLDYATIKYNSSGTQQWATRFAGP